VTLIRRATRRSSLLLPVESDTNISPRLKCFSKCKTILDFDVSFLATSSYYPDELVGFELRKLRKGNCLDWLS
jgi:hypothetical protein